VISKVKAGITHREVAEMFSISVSTLEKYMSLDRKNLPLEGKKGTGRKLKLSAQHFLELKEQVLSNASATLEEHGKLWKKSHGVLLSTSTLSRYLQKLGITLKKSGPGSRKRRGVERGVEVGDDRP